LDPTTHLEPTGSALLSDEDEIAIAGGIIMQETGLIKALLHGGEHFDDVDRAHLRIDERRAREGEVLPRNLLHDLIITKG
jgi:hypothetical protein